MTANNTCPKHYQHKIQPWDYILANNLGYLEGNVVKYISRWKQKGGMDDLAKARHYIDKLIEVELNGEQRPKPSHIQTIDSLSEGLAKGYISGARD